MQHNLIKYLSNNKAVSRILSYCVVLLFVFVIISPNVIVKASSVSVPQPFFPITPWTNTNIKGNYDDLTEEQKDIADYLIGAGAAQYGGMSNYWLNSAYSTSNQVETWFKSLGESIIGKVYNATNFVVTAPQLVASYIGSAIFKASSYNSYNDFTDEVTNSDTVYLEYVPGLSSAWYDFFGVYGSLYQFQFDNNEFVSELEWDTGYLTQSQQEQYIQWINNNPSNVRVNQGFYNNRFGSNMLNTYHNLFINTSEHRCYVTDDNGNLAGGTYWLNEIWLSSGLLFERTGRSFSFLDSKAYSTSYYSNIVDIARDYFNNSLNGSVSTDVCFYSDFIDSVYHGTTWADRERVYNVDDLNLGLPDSLTTIDEVEKDILVDIKGLIDDIKNGVTELKQAVVDNAIVKDDVLEQVVKVLTTTDVIKTSPEVILDVDTFVNLFGNNNDGYIWYLWDMTKPLVLYTRDLLNALVFNGKGIAWIIYGVIGIGIISGVIVKFLL